MTNEKDREEALRFALDNLEIADEMGCECVLENDEIKALRAYITRIRAEAVQAERERISPYLQHTKKCALSFNHAMVYECTCGLSAILSDDQEARNG